MDAHGANKYLALSADQLGQFVEWTFCRDSGSILRDTKTTTRDTLIFRQDTPRANAARFFVQRCYQLIRNYMDQSKVVPSRQLSISHFMLNLMPRATFDRVRGRLLGPTGHPLALAAFQQIQRDAMRHKKQVTNKVVLVDGATINSTSVSRQGVRTTHNSKALKRKKQKKCHASKKNLDAVSPSLAGLPQDPVSTDEASRRLAILTASNVFNEVNVDNIVQPITRDALLADIEELESIAAAGDNNSDMDSDSGQDSRSVSNTTHVNDQNNRVQALSLREDRLSESVSDVAWRDVVDNHLSAFKVLKHKALRQLAVFQSRLSVASTQWFQQLLDDLFLAYTQDEEGQRLLASKPDTLSLESVQRASQCALDTLQKHVDEVCSEFTHYV